MEYGDPSKESTRSDDELVIAHRAGDPNALPLLIERYLHSIFTFTYRMTGKKEDAEDISQDTFVKVWRMLPRYKLTNTFKPWIFAIARNTAIDRLRKKKMLVFSDFEDSAGKNMLIETLGDPDTLPDTLIEKAENKNLIEKVLAELPHDDREILLLHYNEELTFEAIGDILKKPLNTVKSRHRRALAKLRASLEKSP